MNNATNRETFLDRFDILIALGLGLFSLAIYVRTLLPGLVPNDSAEFQTLAYLLDHAHTTGYSVYLMLAHLFTLLPIENVAYRVNLFSAVMGALTVTVVYLNGRLLSGYRWGGAVGALALAISATFWSQSIIAEVYTLGSAFTATIVLMALLYERTGKGRWLFIAALLGGLGVGVHGTVSLLAPAVLALLLFHRRDWPKLCPPALAGLALGVGLMALAFAAIDAHPTQAGILQTAYIPSITRWDMQAQEIDSFGERFAFLVFAKQWQSVMFHDPASVMSQNYQTFVLSTLRDFSLPATILYLLGFASLLYRERRLGVFFLVAIVAHNLYTLNYQIFDIHVFFIAFYVYLSTLIAEGVAFTLRWINEIEDIPHLALRVPIIAVVILLSVGQYGESRATILDAGEARWKFMMLPENFLLQEWQEEIHATVSNLPPDAIVLSDWYNLYGFVYEAYVVQGRTDLSFLEAYPYSTKQGMADSLFVYLKENMAEGRPVYTIHRLDELQRGGLRFHDIAVGAHQLFFVESR